MKTLTRKDFEPLDPPYGLMDSLGEFRGTVIDILNLQQILPEEKIWLITRPAILKENTLRLLSVQWAKHVEYLMDDSRSIEALRVAEKYALNKATKKELKNAWHLASTVNHTYYEDQAVANLAANTALEDFNGETAEEIAIDAAFAFGKACIPYHVLVYNADPRSANSLGIDDAEEMQIQAAIEIIKKYEK